MAAISAGASILSGVVGGIGSIMQGGANASAALAAGQEQQRQYLAEAAAQSFNAKVSKQLAQNAMDVATSDARDYRRVQNARLANSRANQAASGVALTGSPLLVDEAAFATIEHGVAQIVNKGTVESVRLTNQSALQKFYAKNAKLSARYAMSSARASASNARTAGYIGAATGVLGGVSSAGGTLSTAGYFG